MHENKQKKGFINLCTPWPRALVLSRLDKASQPAFTCSKLTTETLEQGEWRRSDIFIVKYFTPCSSASIVSFEIAIADWAIIKRI